VVQVNLNSVWSGMGLMENNLLGAQQETRLRVEELEDRWGGWRGCDAWLPVVEHLQRGSGQGCLTYGSTSSACMLASAAAARHMRAEASDTSVAQRHPRLQQTAS
jgi:hypothetical protein